MAVVPSEALLVGFGLEFGKTVGHFVGHFWKNLVCHYCLLFFCDF